MKIDNAGHLKDAAKSAVQRFIDIPSKIEVDYVDLFNESPKVYRCYWSNAEYVNEKIPRYYGTVDISIPHDIADYDIQFIKIFINSIDQYKIKERRKNKEIVQKIVSE